MAKLHRFLRLNDRFDSQVFTFVLPNKIATDNIPDTYSKDFIYGHHRWTVFFNRSDVHLGCFMKLQTGCNGMKMQIDFSFTLLNKEHYTRNEHFIEKNCVFTNESNQHGRKNFVGLSDLLERDFMQESGEFLVEVEMRKISCTFECYVRVPKETHSRYSYETRLESSYFSYGLFDWSISLFPNEGNLDQDESLALQLHRHTSFDHICNVRYFVQLGENSAFQSEELDQLVDVAGNGDMYIVNSSLYQLTRGRSTLKMKVTMVSVVSVSEVQLNIASRSKSRAHLYDKDKQAWLMEADTSGKHLVFRLYYTDITHVPRKYSRYMCWNILVLTRYIPEHQIKTNYGPYSKYYIQQDLDDGYLIKTTIPVDQLQDQTGLFTEPDDPRLTVHIEWVESHLLATPTYSAYDDIDKLQKQQMQREIMALQSENLVLEKQLHSYQLSIAKAGTPAPVPGSNMLEKVPTSNMVDKKQPPRDEVYHRNDRSSDRVDGRTDRVDRTNKMDRDKMDRVDKIDRYDRMDRVDKLDRYDRNDKVERVDRSERSDSRTDKRKDRSSSSRERYDRGGDHHRSNRYEQERTYRY